MPENWISEQFFIVERCYYRSVLGVQESEAIVLITNLIDYLMQYNNVTSNEYTIENCIKWIIENWN